MSFLHNRRDMTPSISRNDEKEFFSHANPRANDGLPSNKSNTTTSSPLNNFGSLSSTPLPFFSLTGNTKKLIQEITSPGASVWDYITLPYFPFVNLNFRKYLKEFVVLDILAGLTVGTTLVAQGLAYAKLATLPPIYGLYASTIAGYVYTLFGTSGQLTIGPVILVSLFMSSAFISLGIPSSTSLTGAAKNYAIYVKCEMAAVISIAVTIWLCGMAFLRIGSLMRFLSPSVLTGFVTGAGVYIFMSMLRQIFGIKVPREEAQYKEFLFFFTHLPQSHYWSMIIGLVCLTLLIVWHTVRKILKPRIQALRRERPTFATFIVFLLASVPLFLMIVSSGLAWYLLRKTNLTNTTDRALDIIGQVPAGFNKFQYPQIFNDFYGEGIQFGSVMIASIPVTLLVYFESVSIARKYALEYRYPIDMNQELWALGLGCLCGAFFQGYPPGGSFGRTALKAEVGVKTPFANITTSFFVSLVLIWGTQVLTYLPLSVLGATVCISTFNLFDFQDIWKALWVSPRDGLIMVFTLLVSVLWNAEKGLEYGVLLSLLVMLIQLSKLELRACKDTVLQYQEENDPVAASKRKVKEGARGVSPSNNAAVNLPLLDDDESYYQSYQHQYPPAQEEWIRVLRLNANLYFGNAVQFADSVFEILTSVSPIHRPKAVILDASGLVDVDLAALAALEEMIGELSKTGTKVYLAGTCPRVARSLERMDLTDLVGGPALTKLPVHEVYRWVMNGLTLKKRMSGNIHLQQVAKGEAAGGEETKERRGHTLEDGLIPV